MVCTQVKTAGNPNLKVANDFSCFGMGNSVTVGTIVSG